MKKSSGITILLLLAAASLYALPAKADPLTEAVSGCRQQQNAAERLACYDKITLATATVKSGKPEVVANPVNRAVPTTVQAPVRPAPATSAKPVVTAPPTPDNFGLEHKKKTEEQVDQHYLRVRSINYSPRKELIVEFDNGQTWRQSGSGYYKIAVGERHYVKRGMFNSFTLGNDDNNRTIKVRRVQ